MVKIIFFTTLILFPFGQLFKYNLINIFDVFVVLLSIFVLIKKPSYPEWYKYFIYFLISCLFSLLFNYSFFELKSLLYLFRLITYSFVAVYVFNYIKDSKVLESKLLKLSVFSAVFGWIQYIILPDLTFLKYYGWDDHLLRMVGTFFDPTYLGLIFVLGVIIAIKNNNIKSFFFLIVSLAFTYSRINYLILFLILIFKKKYMGLFVFLITILFLPKMIGEGTNLVRTSTTNLKVVNYIETSKIINESPLIGVGFNNLCPARKFYLKDSGLGLYSNETSHSCSGADSSILFIVATTGFVGLILFLSFILQIQRNELVLLSMFAVFIHSFSANSVFYPHIMFWMFALFGLRVKSNSK